MVEEAQPSVSEAEMAYYYYGFRRVLRRYRMMTMIGWIIVLIGFISLFLGWSLGLPHGLIDLVLSTLSITAGILVVQQSVVGLQEYVSIPFSSGDRDDGMVAEVRSLMKEVQAGGWWEARAAAQKLETIMTGQGLAARPDSEPSQFH